MLSQKMSIEEKLIKLLCEPKFRYKGMPVSVLGLPVFFPYKKQSINNTLYKLRKQKYITQNDGLISLLPQGRKYWEKKSKRLATFESPFFKEAPKNLLLMFDIPEGQKAEREWLRYQLREFGFVMIQRSVWVGPSPLPKEFMDYLKEIRLRDCIKTFKLAKSYNTQL